MSKKKKKTAYMSSFDRVKLTEKESDVNSKKKVRVLGELKNVLDEVPNFNDTPKKRQLTVYIDEDVAQKFDEFGIEKGKGAKSEVVNRLLKNALEGYGE